MLLAAFAQVQIAQRTKRQTAFATKYWPRCFFSATFPEDFWSCSWSPKRLRSLDGLEGFEGLDSGKWSLAARRRCTAELG